MLPMIKAHFLISFNTLSAACFYAPENYEPTTSLRGLSKVRGAHVVRDSDASRRRVRLCDRFLAPRFRLWRYPLHQLVFRVISITCCADDVEGVRVVHHALSDCLYCFSGAGKTSKPVL